MSTRSPDWWNGGRKGTMSPWTKAKVFGMHAIAKLQGWKVTNEDIAKVVKKVGGGSPSDQAISQRLAHHV